MMVSLLCAETNMVLERDFLGFLQLPYSATRSQLPHRTIMIIGVSTSHNT